MASAGKNGFRWDWDRCPDCIEKDTAEHTFFSCKEHEEQRREVENVTGVRFTLESCVKSMLASLEGWEAVSKLARIIVMGRESAEGDRLLRR